MVGLMAVSWGERAAGLLDAVKKSAPVASKMEQLRQLKDVILQRDPFLLPEYALQLAELQVGQPGPVRRFLAEAISEIGMKNMDLLPEIVPTLIYLLKDDTPAVARQAITSGTSLFRNVLEKLVIQGFHSNELDQSLDLSWKVMLKFKDAVFPIAFQPGSDGVKLLAIKFIEAMILLYTPDPHISSEPPNEIGDGFSISWVRGCHPVLNVGDLATESSQSLGMLLDQLRFPQVKSLSNSIVIVLINRFEVAPKCRTELTALSDRRNDKGLHRRHASVNSVKRGGFHSNELDQSLDLSWKVMLKFKDAVFPIAFQPGSDGVKLLAIKFIEAMILLYTPDPHISSEPPNEIGDGFSISWVRGCHPVLNVGDLATESSQSLGMLLDQLRFPQVKSLSNSIVIVLINSLSAIAKKRPSFYGRILPVLLALDPATAVIKGMEVSGAHHALKSAFLTFLQCTHPAAAPWRPRVVEALKAMNVAMSAEPSVCIDKSFGSVASTTMEETLPIKEDNLLLDRKDELQGDLARKRGIKEDVGDFMQDDITSGKRARISPVSSQETAKESSQTNPDLTHDNIPLVGTKASTGGGDNGPVQQLVGMFGALVAQGDKAVESLDILISSISSDLLAEVVMANMRHLPPSCPKTEGEQEHYGVDHTSTLVSGDQTFIRPSFMSDILSLSNALALINSQSGTANDTSKLPVKDEVKLENVVDSTSVSPFLPGDTKKIYPGGSIQSVAPTAMETGTTSNASPNIGHNLETLESKIPGLESVAPSDIQEPVDISQSSTSELQGSSQDQVVSSGSKIPFDTTTSGLMSTFSETPSSSATLMDSGLSALTNSASITVSSQYFLPKMTAPVINLTDEQKDDMQKIAFLRIIEAYKQIVIAGGTQIRFSLLACLGVEFPLELDAWGLLQKHILSDYLNHEGHELALRVLYRLFRESEQDQDFFSSRTAISVYETFLLTVAETLRDSFPASDKSLTRLLGEVPYLPKAVFKLLECMCSPESSEKDGKEFHGGDRVTQGLSIVWSLILLRPSNRDICLKIALQSAVHHLEEVRMKAIRLVANKLYPMSYIAEKIEEFANDMLLSVVNHIPASEDADPEGPIALPKDTDTGGHPNAGQPPRTVASNEAPSDSHELCKNQTLTSSSISEAQRRMSLYFALCTKKHSLLLQLFTIYQSMPKPAKQAVHGHIPILVRTIGCSPDLLRIISDLPDGSQGLLIQVLHTLMDGQIASKELVSSVRTLYATKLKDVEIVIPVLSSLSKDEVLSTFPNLVNLSMDKFQVALARILQGSPHSGPSLTPAEVLIAIHEIDPEKDGIPLKKVMDACSACFEQRQVFTQQVLAKALNQLVEQIPLPLLFMRTVIQAIGVFPALVDFVMEILSRLVNKQIWKYPKLWVGFLKCALQMKPQSFSVLLQLPAAQLENALNRNPVLKSPLIEHASQPNIRSTLPRPTLAVLGLSSDSQASGQAQPTQSQHPERGNSGTDGGAETTQESTDVS